MLENNDVLSKVFYCNKNKNDLRGTNALKYIENGEGIEMDFDDFIKEMKKW